MRLPPEVEAAGYRLTYLDATGSTNDDAAEAVRAGDPGRHWFVAGEQRAGRGRHGRPWASPPGNLSASLLLVEPCEPALAPQLGFVAGLALHEAVSATTGVGPPRLSLKWPNDLLLDGAKAAGLLLEGHCLGPAGLFALVIGIGVNVVAAPGGTPYPTATLRSAAPFLTAETLVCALARSFAEHFEVWGRGLRGHPADAFATVRRRWLDRAAGIGDPVTVRLPGGDRTGIFLGLDSSGRLELHTPTGTELVDAGDLYFLRSRPGGVAPDRG